MAQRLPKSGGFLSLIDTLIQFSENVSKCLDEVNNLVVDCNLQTNKWSNDPYQ